MEKSIPPIVYSLMLISVLAGVIGFINYLNSLGLTRYLIKGIGYLVITVLVISFLHLLGLILKEVHVGKKGE